MRPTQGIAVVATVSRNFAAHSAAPTGARRWLMANVTVEKLRELYNKLDTARSAVYVSATALDHGETDLELHSAATLKEAFGAINEVYDQLVALKLDLRGPKLSGKAARILSVVNPA
jgi:hypothetical protein